MFERGTWLGDAIRYEIGIWLWPILAVLSILVGAFIWAVIPFPFSLIILILIAVLIWCIVQLLRQAVARDRDGS